MTITIPAEPVGAEPVSGTPEPPEPPAAGRNLPIAILTGAVLGALALLTLFTSALAFLGLVAVVVAVAQLELYTVLRRRGLAPADQLGAAVGAVLLGAAYGRGADALSFGLTFGVAATLLWYLADPARERVGANLGATVLGIVYVPFLAAHIVLLRALPDGASLTLVAVLATVVYDVAAYAGGTMFGRHRMAPVVSPGKTWEGAVAASLAVFATALLAGPAVAGLDPGASAALGLVIAAAAPAGDLAESMLKRDVGVKDTGALLPGHGGSLDRIDALLFTMPAAYWLLRAVA